LRSSGKNSSGQVLTLVMGVCLVAVSLFATEGSTVNSAHKPAARVASSHTATTHPAVKKPAASVPVSHSHSATRRRGASPALAVHHAAGKSTGHASAVASAKGTSTHSTAYASQRKGTTGRGRYSRPAHPRPLSGQQRLARLHLAPERVQAIQQALIRDGYLHGDATGEWDTPTREAMLRYQTMHGFPATGLPEAKSLMKMGLGPHPLSPELDHGEVGVASAGVTATVQSVFSPTPNAPPDSHATAPNSDTTPSINK
jgi:peptidoglycan hydrolase-like protein with peptidoglycan-binding domain